MARGGARPGAGRKPGVTATTNDLLRRVRNRVEDGHELSEALAMIYEDADAPYDVRVAALRRLAGALYGKLILTAREENSSGWRGA